GGPMRRWWIWGLLLGAAVAVGAYWLRSEQSQAAAEAAARAQASRAIPVVAASARKGDLRVYLSGLGTVTALKTVTVRSRVDGQLVSVPFGEGQTVRQGDLLAAIDPRPFQVQLTQAEGQYGKDKATLENARIDLERYRILVQQDSIPRQQLDTQVATVHQLEA